MAISYICGFEMGGLAGSSSTEADSSTATLAVALSTSVVRSGTHACRLVPTAAAAWFRFRSRAAAGSFRNLFMSAQFYMRVASLPSAAQIISLSTTSASAAASSSVRLRLNTNGTLEISANNGTNTATSTPALSVDGLWHRISIDAAYTGGAGARVYVDDVLWASSATGTPATLAGWQFGDTASLTSDLYFDDIVFYDAALPSVLTDYSVGLSYPVNDSADGGWVEADGAGNTDLYTGVDNKPPQGRLAGTVGTYISNAISSATDNYDATCSPYDSFMWACKTVGSETTSPVVVAFSTDGRRMFLNGAGGVIYQYDLSSTWNVASAVYGGVFKAVTGQDATPQGLAFKSDGTKMYVAGSVSGAVYQYTLSSAWDLSTATYDTVSKSVTTEEAAPTSLAFKSDGTKMYIAGSTADSVYQYTLSSAWDLSTATYDTVSKSVTTEDTVPRSAAFKSDGTKMYMMGRINTTVYQYTLSSAWDLSTATYDTVSFSVAEQDRGTANNVSFSNDGTQMYLAGSTADSVYQYTLSSAWDLSTASLARFGVTSGDVVLAVQAICNDGQAVTTGSPKAGAVVITSNPSGQTEQSFDYGLPNGATGTTSAVQNNTWSVGWGTHLGPVTENPSLTLSSGPVVRVGKRTATTRVVDVCILAVYVMWTSPPVPHAPHVAGQAINRAGGW